MTPWRAVRLVTSRELREGLRNRAYMITFGISLVLVVVGIVVPALLQSDDPVRLGVVGASQVSGDEVVALAERFDIDLEVTTVEVVADAEQAILDGELDVALVDGRELVVEETIDPTLRAVLADAVGQRAMLERLGTLGIDDGDAAEMLASGAIEVRTLDEPTDGTAIAFAFGGTILMLMAVTFFASAVLMGVVEEKSSRVVEVVLGAMRPWQLLAGKLIGIGSLAFVQVTVLVLVATATLRLAGTTDLPEATGAIVAAVIGWFVLGFAFYSTVYAAAGSLASRVEDAQSSAGPIGFVLFAAYFATFAVVLPNPDGMAARIMSVVPPLAPLTMPARVALGAVTVAEMALAVVLILLTIVGAVLLAARVYRRSVLQTRRMTWREALRSRPV